MDTATKTTDITTHTDIPPTRHQEYWHLLVATIAMGFPMARTLVPAFVKPGLLMPLVLLLIWFIWRLTQPRRLITTPLGLPLLATAAIVVASSFASNIAGKETVTLLFHWGAAAGIILFLTIDVLAHGWRPETITRAVLLTISVGGIYTIWVIVSWWASWLRVWQPGEVLLPVTFRRNLFNTQPNQAAMLINIGMPLASIALWQARTRWQQLLWAFWLFWAVILLFYTSSRGGWLASTAIATSILTPLLWSMVQAHQWKRMGITLIVAGAYAALFATLFLSNYRGVHAQHAGKQGIASSAPEPANVTVSETIQGLAHPVGRNVFWGRALHMVQEHPLLGTGPNGYQTYYRAMETNPKGFIAPHAHNIYLALLAETGILGALVFALLIGSTIRLWWKGWRTMRPQSDEWTLMIGCAAVGVGMAVHGLVDVPTRQTGGTVLYVLAAGLGVAHFWRLAPSPEKDFVARKGAKTQRPDTRPGSLHIPSPQRGVTLPLLGTLSFPHPVHAALVSSAVLAWGISILVIVAPPPQPPHTPQDDPIQHVHTSAQDALQQGKSGKALAYYDAALQEHPDNLDLRRERATVLAWQARNDAAMLPTALATQEAVLDAAPNDETAMINRAALLHEMGMHDQAQTLLHTLVVSRTNDPVPRLLLARSYEQTGDSADAQTWWHSMLAVSPMLAHSVACRQSAICSQIAVPDPWASEAAALATAWYQVEHPNEADLEQIETLAQAMHSVDLWSVGVLIADRVGNPHKEKRFLLAALDQSQMMDHTHTMLLDVALLHTAIKNHDEKEIQTRLNKLTARPDLRVIPQVTSLQETGVRAYIDLVDEPTSRTFSTTDEHRYTQIPDRDFSSGPL